MGTGSVYRRGNHWWFRFQVNGQPYYGNTNQPTKGLAKLKLAEEVAKVYRELGKRAPDRHAEVSVPDATELWRVEAKRSSRDLAAVYKLAKWLGDEALIADIKAADISDWINDRVDDEAAGSTVCRELSAISAFFTWARKRSLCPTNPVREVPRPDGTWIPPEPLTREEVAAVLDRHRMDPVLGPALHFAYWAGLRRGELLRVTTAHIEGENLLVPGTKTAKSRARLPILPGLSLFLGGFRPNGDFYVGGKENAMSKHGIASAVRRQKKADEQQNERAKKDKRIESVVVCPNLHQLRHSIGHHMLVDGLSIHEVAAFLRNTVRMIEKVYGHYDATTFRDRFAGFKPLG